MKPLFSKSFWCMLAVVLLTSFSARADIEDAIDDLFKVKNDTAGISNFCKANGNYKLTQAFVEALPGPFILYVGKVNCFPQTTADTIDKCNSPKTMVAGWVGEEQGGRWWEGIFNALSNASATVTDTTWDNVAGDAVKLLSGAFALWLALITMPMVGSFKEQNPADYLMKVGTKAFKVMFAVLLLQNKDFFFETLISPVISTAAGFVGVATSGDANGVKAVMQPLKELMEGCHTSLSEGKAVGKILMTCLNKVDAFILVLGVDLWIVEIGTAIKLFDFWNLWVTASGCAIWISMLVLSIAFPFRVFDAIFRLGIILALSPLYIMAWVFDLTKDFAVKGFNSVLQVAFLFMFLKITLDLCVDLIFEASGIGDVMSASSGVEAGMQLIKPFMTAAALGKILVIAICLLFCLGMLMKVDDLANTFSSVSYSGGVADQAANKMIAQPAKAVAGKAAGAAKEVAHAKFENMAKNAMNNSKEGSLKRSLARSYLRSRGVTNDDVKEHAKSKSEKAAEKQEKIQAKQQQKEEKQQQKEQRKNERAQNKEAKQHQKEVNKDALMNHGDERKALAKQIRGETLSEDEQKSIDQLQKDKPEVFESVKKSAQKEAFNPVKAKANDMAGKALKTREAQKQFHHNVGQAVKNKAHDIRDKQKQFHHNVGEKVKNSAPVTAVRNAGTAIKTKAGEVGTAIKEKAHDIREDQKKFHAAVAKPFKDAGSAIAQGVKNSAPVKAVKEQVQNAKEYREQRNDVVNAQKEVSQNSGDKGAQERLANAREALANNKNAPKFMKKISDARARIKGNKLARKDNKD